MTILHKSSPTRRRYIAKAGGGDVGERDGDRRRRGARSLRLERGRLPRERLAVLEGEGALGEAQFDV